jgi:hypothetical protein
MKLNKIIGLAITTLVLNMSLLTNAHAVSVNVKCDARNGRSQVSVDGDGLQGQYQATVTSGGATVKSATKTADPITREAEFDFDSKRADIAAGATAIPFNFIKNARVVGSIFAVGSATPVASAIGICRTR